MYISMFKRPLLCRLNQIWRTIVEMEGKGSHYKAFLKKEMICEIIRCIGLVPLAFINLRTGFDPMVGVSDASTSGGGFCVPRGLTPYGTSAATAPVRGELPSEDDSSQILSIGMFDGIAALRVALDCLGIPVAGHISIEKNPQAQRVVESFFPECTLVQDVEEVNEEMVKGWALKLLFGVSHHPGSWTPLSGGIRFE